MNRRSALESVLYDAKQKYQIEDDIPFESISYDMKIYVCHNVKQKCKQNVVGALYADLGGLFYSFSKTDEWIKFNPRMYEFVCKHKVAIEKVNYYEWARFLERVNDSNAVDHLLNKIDESTLHTRNSLTYYRDILFEEFENKCFYCGKPVHKGSVQVDHFIPWSFIKDDQLWNFVLACPECNNHKRDKLADILFVDRIEKRNIVLIERHRSEPIGQYNRVRRIYDWAQRNSYNDIWRPKINVI